MRKSEILDSSDLRLPTSIEESSSLTIPDTGLPLAETIDKVEISIINQALKSTGGNYSKAASLLGITRQNLNYKLHKYNIRKEEE